MPSGDVSAAFPDETPSARGIISWDTYRRDRPIFDQLTDIQRFSLLFDVPPIPELASRDFAGVLSTRMYRHVRDAVNSANFHAIDELTLRASANDAAVSYEDDLFEFSVRVSDGAIGVHRQGSRFSDFHGFYSSLFMHIPQMMNEIRREIAEATGRECTFVRGQYTFEFLVHDFRARGSGRAVRNSQVIGSLINGLPGDDGVLSAEPKVLASAARVDLNISRWIETESGMRVCRYVVQAPSNKAGAALWIKLAYGAETYSNPDSPQERTPFDPEHFLDESDRAYVSFLRDTAIDGFLRSLFKEYNFKTSAYLLP